jgi:endonuclease G
MPSSSRVQRTPVPLRLKALSVAILVSLILATLPIPFISFISSSQAASPNIVISQVYGGGGSGTAGTAYTNDYVELFNTSNAAVPIGGWSIQYGSSTGQFGSSSGNIFTFPAGTSLPAGRYLTVKLGAPGTAGATFTADFTSSGLSMAAGSGKVALVNGSAALGCGATATPCALPDSRIVDAVAYGASNNAEGGTPVNNGTGLNSTNGAVRKSNGCTDTDNNNNDFVVATTATGLVPRTLATNPHTCGAVANQPPTINAPANPIATVNQDAPPFTVSLAGNDDGGIYNWSAAPGAGVSSVSVTGGQGTANVTYTVTLQSGFNGTASFTASLSDNVNPAVTRVVNITVNSTAVNNPPTITVPANPIKTVEQNAAPFNVSLSGNDDAAVYDWSATPGTGVSTVLVTAGQGTASATYNVTLQSGFNGTATFTASLSDGVNPAATQAVNITVNAPPPPLDHMVISQVYGGGGNSGATYQNDYVELFNAGTTPFDLGGWTVQYASATGTSWQAQPLGGVVQPGEYYLISLASGGAVGALLPVEANVNGSINISGTTGKIALVSNGDPLDGCPTVGSPGVVDFVGYGTANCREGATNAPAPSNTTAIFRKNGGFTDTNVNGSDFQTGTPNPRRTAIISEIGPYVLNVDPRNNATTAPRDASLTITFTEPVDVTGAWYNINCVVTGPHNDATIGGSGSFRIITPNVNFQPGEQCTATVFKNSVSDSDLDDGPDTNNLKADYTWSFTIATGAAPAYGPEVHLMMGNPNGATADINQPNNYLMEKPEFSLSYNRDKGTPNWVSWHLASEWIGSLVRVDTFRPDPAVPSDWYRVLHTDYFGSGFDRGHMVPNADRDPETSMPINQATFLMSNMIPQAPDNNQGPWAAQENYLRTLLPANELYIIAGGAGTGGDSGSGVVTTIANGHVTVPEKTWKVALVLPKGEDDISRVTCGTRTIAVIMPNVQGIRNVPWETYITTVDEVEKLTGYDFFSNLPDAVENCVEAGTNGTNPPGTVNQSVTTFEDKSVQITLEAVMPNNNTPTFSIVAAPENGTLGPVGAAACTNRNCTATVTYTPGADYDGSDSFTFRASDGALHSSASTVSITVTPDEDSDEVADASDNCLTVANANQENSDGDTQGDACDADDDNDGVSDEAEVAAGSNPLDANSIPEVCDGLDNDLNDGIDEGSTNTDNDSQADCVDTDDDGDGTSDDDEMTAGSDPLNSASTPEVCDGADNDLNDGIDEGFVNTDGDTQADCVDADDDNDGVSDVDEIAAGSNPLNSASKPEVCDGVDNDLNEGVDEGFANTDGDGQADCVDADDDGDGQTDADEIACGSDPLAAGVKATDTDGDNRPDCVDTDDDGDGVLDGVDNCPLRANPDQADFDGDGTGNTCDDPAPTGKDQCKNGGWQTWLPLFKNQGDCIQYVNTGK